MNMEHRWNRRSRLSLDVVIHGRDGFTLHGSTRDISPGGMFIQLAQPATGISRVVDIEISRRIRLPCWLVHAGKEGVGVMFLAVDDGEEGILDQLLSCSMENKSGKDAA